MAEKYQKIVSDAFCYGNIAYAFSLAKEHGIFATLLESEVPLTSDEIAKRNNIRERYVRELLGCLSGVELVEVNPSQDGGALVYHLEAAAKGVLRHGASLPFMIFIKIIGSRYEGVSKCLEVNNPAVSRYSYSFFDALEEMRVKTSAGVIDLLFSNVSGLEAQLEKGIEVIEFGCGMAYNMSQLAARFPSSTFTATDVLSDVIDTLRYKYSHLTNLKFEVVNLCSIPSRVDKKYDWLLTNDVIHDLPHPLEALKGIRRLARGPEAVYTCIEVVGTGSHRKDVGNLLAACLYAFSTFVCLPESYQHQDSEAHGACWGKSTFLELAKAANFETSVVPMEGIDTLFICRPV